MYFSHRQYFRDLNLQRDLEHILKHTTHVWDVLRGKTVFVTGGTGFFGKWILESFCYANEQLELGAEMIVLTRSSRKFLETNPQFDKSYISFLNDNIIDFEFPDTRIDYIIHAATDMSGYGNMQYAMDVNNSITEGTRRVLELAKACDTRSVLLTSSGAVYGRQPASLTHIHEGYNGAPDLFDVTAAYGESKRVAEMYANIYYHNYGIQSKIARCFAFVGPYIPLNGVFAIGNFMNDALRGKEIVIKGDGTPLRSYLYTADLAIWLWRMLVDAPPCRPYNVGSGQEYSLEDVARMVVKVAGGGSVQILQPASGQPPAQYVPDVKRAKEELNLEVFIDLEESIRRTLAFYK